LGFSKWKKPLCDFLESEINGGQLQSCKGALERFWKKTLEVNSKEFREKTKEEPDDRRDSVYFFSTNLTN